MRWPTHISKTPVIIQVEIIEAELVQDFASANSSFLRELAFMNTPMSESSVRL